ncbi:hypothetical protein [Isoptericola halotolerans]|uniref:Uncharacterized protein n=1 Tax=Isoptericola halotolerans TaxID=300560 RepID=A0ABX2A8Y2_9MICO|nr:hypothetical protein [Isoptericola halotolerans]
MIRPRWEWALADQEGRRLEPSLSPVFTTQYDAEQWLGEHWRRLAGAGAVSATLLHDGAQATPVIELRIP